MDELKSLLHQQGASDVGFADLTKTELHEKLGYPFGVSIAVALNPVALQDVENGPTKTYHAEYERVNNLLDDLSIIGANFLIKNGHKSKSFAATNEGFIPNVKHTTNLPHKTLSTLSGIGWIGKCALLVTENYGSAVRLTSILTECELECGTPVKESECDSCFECVDLCPGNAPNGKNWSFGMKREDFFDPDSCRKAARELALRRTGILETFCGICIVSCPYTRRYISKNLQRYS